MIARLNYTDRGYDQSTLYELESYPVFSNKVYAFLNLGISDGTLYPDLRSSASLFVNIFSIFELETGARLLRFFQMKIFTPEFWDSPCIKENSM